MSDYYADVEKEDVLFEVNALADQIQFAYQKKEKIWKIIKFFLLETWTYLRSNLVIFKESKELSEGEKFLEEIIGELEGIYTVIEQFRNDSSIWFIKIICFN
jgi:hypothetical protein